MTPTSPAGSAPGEDALYVLLKRGVYYCPNAMGYTGVLDEAGRYSKADAEAHVARDPNRITMLLASEAPRFSPECWWDTRVKVLEADIAALLASKEAAERENAALHDEASADLEHRLQRECALAEVSTERDALARMVGEMSAELALMAIRCNSLLDDGDEAWQRILDDANNRAAAALAATADLQARIAGLEAGLAAAVCFLDRAGGEDLSLGGPIGPLWLNAQDVCQAVADALGIECGGERWFDLIRGAALSKDNANA